MTALAARIDGQVAELSSLRAGIEVTERRYPEGAPPTVYGEHSRSLLRFNSMVERHNSDVERYQSLSTSYSLRVDKYNGEVNEANALSGAIGGTWYVVPVPGGGGRALAR